MTNESETAVQPESPDSCASLSPAMALPLLHVLVQRMCRELGIRVLFIKSLAATHHGLRARRSSADVDALVDPSRISDLVAALGDDGWRTRPRDHAADLFVVHSMTLLRARWPADLDLHYRFPGLVLPNQQLFERLWDRRSSMSVAGFNVDIPSWEDTAVIEATNYLRTPGIKESRDYLATLTETIKSTKVGPDLFLEAAISLRALGATAPFLKSVGQSSPMGGWSPPTREWVIATSKASGVLRPALRILTARPSERLRWFKHAFWPSDDYLSGHNVYLDSTGLRQLRMHRWRKFVGRLPSTVGTVAMDVIRLRSAVDRPSTMPAALLDRTPPSAHHPELGIKSFREVDMPEQSEPVELQGTLMKALATAVLTAEDGVSYYVLPADSHDTVFVSGLAATVLGEVLEHGGTMSRRLLDSLLIEHAPLPEDQAICLIDQAVMALIRGGVLCSPSNSAEL